MSSIISIFNDRILNNPWRASLLLMFWVVFINGYGIGSLEFVRHTEADRTLIAMEMNESGNYLVPTLLGSQILTKPPLYYWISAFFLKTLNSSSEGVARLTSLFSSALFVFLTYWFWFIHTGKRRLSAYASFALSCSVLFYILSSLAEIDMIFGFLTSCTLYAAFFLYEKFSVLRLINFSILVSFAFLAKGPPVYFFCLGSIGLFFLFDMFFKVYSFRNLFKKISWVLLGLLLALAFLSIWLVPLGLEVGWESLKDRLDEEVIKRVLDYSDRNRGSLFYIGALLVNSLPWSIFLLIGVINFFKTTNIKNKTWYESFGGYLINPQVRRLFLFSMAVVVSGFVMLSIAQGKSSRYCFPLIPFLINISVVLSPAALSKVYFKKILFLFRIVCFISLFLIFGVYVFGDVKGVTTAGWIISGCFIIIASIVGLFSPPLWLWRGAIPLIGFLFLTVKIVQTHVYVPHRNVTRSVHELSQNIVSIANQLNAPIYTLELFDRWSVFYAKQQGIHIYRLTPELVKRLMLDTNGETILFLDLETESWRYYQAKIYSDKVKLTKILPHVSSSSFLMSVPNSIIDKLDVFSAFPTHPSIPFYTEVEMRK